MPRKLYSGPIPMTEDGDLIEYTRQPKGIDLPLGEVTSRYSPEYRIKQTIKWVENHVFHARMRVADMERGRSAARFVLEDENGSRYPMFMADMMILTERGIEPGGYSEGDWAFCKRGQNYGVTPV